MLSDLIKLDNNNRLTFGGEFRTDGRKDSSIDESSDQYSLFIHDELKLEKLFQLRKAKVQRRKFLLKLS